MRGEASSVVSRSEARPKRKRRERGEKLFHPRRIDYIHGRVTMEIPVTRRGTGGGAMETSGRVVGQFL